MKRRVDITGMGAVTPLATGIEPSRRALCAGRSGIFRVPRFDTSKLRIQIAGEVKVFNPLDFIVKKLADRTDRYRQFALAAARMALKDAGLTTSSAQAERVESPRHDLQFYLSCSYLLFGSARL